MSKRSTGQRQRRVCSWKRKHPSREVAEFAMNEGQHRPGRLVVYRCRACGSWHVGHAKE